ncbi:MAG: GlsB/YeaQ/YmgE family stress response membrane protein [Filomicrobium sp.]
MDAQTKKIVLFLVIGIVAGWLASFIVGGGGLIRYLVSGVLGAYVGGYLLDLLGVKLGISNPLLAQIATSTIGAIVVVIVANLIV